MLLAQQAARAAGQHAFHHQAAARAQLKFADELVTDVDRQCQQIIIDHIRRRFPDHGFLAEEASDAPLLKIPPTGEDNIWWVIDPIDGTRNFSRGGEHYAVSVAALHNGNSIIGAIYVPASETMFSASWNGPTMRNGVEIHCRDEHLHRNSIIAIPGHAAGKVHPALITFMENYACVALGSAALHYVYVATGTYVGACSWLVKLWDIAAGAVICQSAGVHVTDITGKPLFPVDCEAYNGGPVPIIVAPPIALKEIADIIGQHPDR